MSRTPCACSVSAQVRMMKYITMLEKNVADSNIEFSIVDFLSRHAFTLSQHSATHGFVFLHFL